MKHWFNILVCLLACGSAPVGAEPLPNPPPDYWYSKIVDIEFVRPYAVLPRRDDVLLIDARDAGRRFAPGHLPGAINLPAKRFDELAPHLLPADKNKLIIYYCDGIKCKLSHMAAEDTEDLGYTNIRVYAGGFPEWFAQGNVVAVAAHALKRMLAAGEVGMVFDVRDQPGAFERGHLPAAVSLPAAEFERQAAAVLPADKNSPLLVYDDEADGSLSYAVARKAVALGYHRVLLLDGGYPAWQAEVPAGGQGAQ